MMRTSEQGLLLIKLHEGLRLEAYLDRFANVWSVGFGHTGDDVYAGLRITEGQANELLKQDIITAERAVRHSVMVQLLQREFDALVSFTYNLGSGALRGSTLLKKLNAGDRVGAAAEFTRWNQAGGRPLMGLLLRRWRECGLWLGTWEPAGEERAA